MHHIIIMPHIEQALNTYISLKMNAQCCQENIREVTMLLPAVQFCACFVSCDVLTWNDGLRTQYTKHQCLRVCTHSLLTADCIRSKRCVPSAANCPCVTWSQREKSALNELHNKQTKEKEKEKETPHRNI